jgi:hypothetical protein
MNRTQLKTLMAIAAGTSFILPAAAGVEMETTPPEPVLKKQASNDSLFPIRVQSPKILADGTASFVIDLSRLNPFQFVKLLSSNKTLLLFRDPPAEPEKLCPYFELASRPYEVRQIDPEKTIYRISAKISPDEMAEIQKAGCLITKTISRHEIKPYQP